MIGNTPASYGIDKNSHRLSNRIFRDLEEGRFSFLADEKVVEQRYNAEGKGSAWQDFRRACRAYATVQGCLVLVNDTYECFVDSSDINGEYDEAMRNDFAIPSATRYRERLRDLGKRGSVRLTLYRLPRANYENVSFDHFEKRGEYVGEINVGLG